MGTGALGVKQPGREADHSRPSSAEVEECVDLYLHSLNTRTKWAEHVARMWELRCVHNFVGKSEGNRPIWRSKRGWHDSIKMDLEEMWCESVEEIHVT